MNILATQYTLTYKSLDIYVAGCSGSPHCPNCHNPESWSFIQGELYNKKYFKKLKLKIKDFDILVHNIMIFGGEPLDQNYEQFIKFLQDLKELNKKVWIFTRYKLNEVPQDILELCDYIKCGRYIEELTTEDNTQYGIKLATSNQCIYKKGIDF